MSPRRTGAAGRGRAARIAWWTTLGLALAAAAPQARAASDAEHAEPSALATSTLLLDVATAGERLVAVGQHGHVLLSDDRGQSWRQARRVPTRVTLTGLFFVDAREGWAVGHDAVVLHTSDGGETWELQHRDPELEIPLLAVRFADGRSGLAVGAFGTLLETRSGGRSWERRLISDDPDEELHLNHVFAGPEDHLFIAAEAGSVFRSADGGATWQRLAAPYSGSFWSGMAVSDGGVLVVGMRGHAFRSPDLGETWQPVPTGTDQSLSDVARLSDGSIVAVGLGGAIVRSDDGGRSFSARVEPDRKGFASVAEGADGSLLLFGESGVRQRAVGPPLPLD